MANEQNKSITTMVVLVLIAAAIVAAVMFLYFRPAQEEAKTITVTPPAVQPATPETVEPEPVRPVYEAPKVEPQEEPLPALSESDNAVLAAFNKLSADAAKLIVPEEAIRKFVRAVNAMEEGKVVHEYRPLVSPAPPFQVERQGTMPDEQVQQYRLLSENYKRYDKYVATFAMLDTDALVATYKRFYPLLEEAYREMGLKKGNFHTVMLGAIDNLLAAPVKDGDVLLVRPKVFYQYADPELEKLPATHKLLMRMGPDNTRSLQASLKTLRIKLTE